MTDRLRFTGTHIRFIDAIPRTEGDRFR